MVMEWISPRTVAHGQMLAWGAEGHVPDDLG